MSDDDEPTSGARENGPLVARNISTMRDARGNDAETTTDMAPCRNGHIQNKPHRDAGWKDDS